MRHSSIISARQSDDLGTISLHELRVWAVTALAIAYWANIIRSATEPAGWSFSSVVHRVIENGAFDICAWGLIFARACSASNGRSARAGQIMATAILAIVVVVPARIASAAGMGLLAVMLFNDPRPRRATRQIGLLLLVLALEIVWRSPFVAPLHVLVATLDASVVTAMLNGFGESAVHHANLVDNASSGFGIVVWPYCTSTMPLAGVGIAFAVTVLYRDRPVRKSYLPWLLLSLLASVVLTEIRLTSLATGAENYDWVHSGPGATMYSLAGLALAVAFPILATSDSRAGKHETTERTVA